MFPVSNDGHPAVSPHNTLEASGGNEAGSLTSRPHCQKNPKEILDWSVYTYMFGACRE